ncbi:MAG: PD40 domain-containing protein [Anaerolineae bacterium]|nr:PD40 domain-containing protein [Anaerolineae bacterium]
MARTDKHSYFQLLSFVLGLTLLLVFAPANNSLAWSQRTMTSTSNKKTCSFIAFVSNRDGENAIFIMEVNNKEAYRVTDPTVDSGSPSWSPDGRYIAFQSESNAYIFDLQNNSRRKLADTVIGGFNVLAWSPNGKLIAFASWRGGDVDIYTINPDGSNLRRVTYGHRAIFGLSWSSDSQEIVYSGSLSGEPDNQINIVAADGSKERTLIEGNVGYPTWSPDSKWIVFVSEDYGVNEVFTIIYRSDLSGNVVKYFGNSNSHLPSWSFDGSYLSFTEFDPHTGNYDIYMIGSNGLNPRNLTDHPSADWDSSWSPKSVPETNFTRCSAS